MELNKIYNVDVLVGLKQLPDESVDLIITSPPYNKNMENVATIPLIFKNVSIYI